MSDFFFGVDGSVLTLYASPPTVFSTAVAAFVAAAVGVVGRDLPAPAAGASGLLGGDAAGLTDRRTPRSGVAVRLPAAELRDFDELRLC